jgi:hypothetical protein
MSPSRGDRAHARSIFHAIRWKIDRAHPWVLGIRDDPGVFVEDAASV